MGPDKKKFKKTCHLTFLEKKIVTALSLKTLLPIKVKTKNQDQSPSSKKSQIQKRISIPP